MSKKHHKAKPEVPSATTLLDPASVNRAFTMKKKEDNEAAPDGYTLLSMLFGTLGLVLKYRVMGWASLVFCVMAMTTGPSDRLDFKNLLSTYTISLVCLGMLYFGPAADKAI